MRPELDDLKVIRSIDPSDMLSQILSFPGDISNSLVSGIELKMERKELVVCGMGGSAIGGEILSDHLNLSCGRRASVIRGAVLPGWLDADTLVVVVSYSGSTMESIRMFQDALKRDSALVGISSGGALMELCNEHGVPHVRVPSGYQPRAALGHLLGAMARIVEESGIAPVAGEMGRLIDPLLEYQAELLPSVPANRSVAKRIALSLEGKIPVLYSTPYLRSAAIRWQTQINENAKMMAFSGIFPECNHNHLVGWLEGDHEAPFLPVFIKGASEVGYHLRILDKTVEYMRDEGVEPLVVEARGHSRLHNVLSAVMLGDFVSYYLAMLRRIDPFSVACIQELKRRIG